LTRPALTGPTRQASSPRSNATRLRHRRGPWGQRRGRPCDHRCSVQDRRRWHAALL